MKKLLITVFSFLSVTQVLALDKVKVCGRIQDNEGLVFTGISHGRELEPSPVYSFMKEIDDQLVVLTGFRRVCLLVSSSRDDEGDTVVFKILSRDENY